MFLIDAELLYKNFAKLESDAFTKMLSIDPERNREDWLMWNAVLNERTAFKHDVKDAPAVDARLNKYAYWVHVDDGGYCSECYCDMPMFENFGEYEYIESKFCPACGATMVDEEMARRNMKLKGGA